MAAVDPVSADAATNAIDLGAIDANNATTLPPLVSKQKARTHWDLEQEDEQRLRTLVTLRAPNLAFANLTAHALRLETRPVSVDDPEIARRTEDAWLALFREASSDAARQELRGMLDKHLTGKPPPLHKSWTMLAEEAELQTWYEDAAWDRACRNAGLTSNDDAADEAKREKVFEKHCAFLEQESFYPDKRRNADTRPFMAQYGKEVATNRGTQPDAAPAPYREHEDVVQAWRQFFQDPRPGVVDGANLSFEQAKLKLEDEARWELLKCMPTEELDRFLFALLDEHGPTQFELEWYGEDLRDQAKRVVLELFVGAKDGHAVRKTFDKSRPPLSDKIIQGGVLFRGGHARQLKAKLDAHRYDCTSDKFAAYLFCNRDGKWEAAALGLQTFPWEGHFGSYNITPVRLHDPTPDKPWGKEELEVFYSIVDDVRDQLAAGKIAVVACMMGKNRSKAVLHALNPTPANEPTCDSMRRAAEGYRKGKDLSIVPLKPERATGKRGR